MARRLTEEQWSGIRARYKSGDKIRQIARDFDIPHGTIQARIKKENWTQEIASKITDIKQKINEISQVAKIEEMPIIEAKIQQEISEQLALIKSIQNLDKGALNLHGIILKKTISKAMSGEMSEQEASRIAQSMGLSVDKVAARAGIGREPQTQVNIQNNANAVADANLEDIVRRVLSSDDENDIISQLEEMC